MPRICEYGLIWQLNLREEAKLRTWKWKITLDYWDIDLYQKDV